MKIEDILDLTLREVLETYCAIYNSECGYYYGITSYDNVEKLYSEYDIENQYPEAYVVENLIYDEILVSFDEKIMDYSKLERIMKNLGIEKKS